MNHGWPEAINMRLISVEPSDDGEWWADFEDADHGEITVRIKLMERPADGAVWQLSLYDPAAVS